MKRKRIITAFLIMQIDISPSTTLDSSLYHSLMNNGASFNLNLKQLTISPYEILSRIAHSHFASSL